METKEKIKEHIYNKYLNTNISSEESISNAVYLAYSLGLKETNGYEPYGYLFEGKFYGDLEMLSSKTMSEDNKPLPLFVKTDSEERDMDIKEWISVKEKLPEKDIPVLVYLPENENQFKQLIVGYDEYGFREFELHDPDLLYDTDGTYQGISHWKYLEKAPNL